MGQQPRHEARGVRTGGMWVWKGREGLEGLTVVLGCELMSGVRPVYQARRKAVEAAKETRRGRGVSKDSSERLKVFFHMSFVFIYEATLANMHRKVDPLMLIEPRLRMSNSIVLLYF